MDIHAQVLDIILQAMRFLFFVLLLLTLRFGIYYRNWYVKIYSVLCIIWELYILGLDIESSIMFGSFSLLNLLLSIVPLIPLWILYHKRDRTEENRRWREMGGKVKGDTEAYKIFLDTGCKKCPNCGSENLKYIGNYRVDCLDCGWLYIDGKKRMTKPKPKYQPKRMYGPDPKKAKKIPFNAKGLTDRELIDKYIDWDEFLEHTAGFALTEGAGMDEWDSINAEIKRRGITDEQIEKRRKELYKIWGIKYDKEN